MAAAGFSSERSPARCAPGSWMSGARQGSQRTGWTPGAAQRRGSDRRTALNNSVRRSKGCPRPPGARACLPMAVVLSLPNRKYHQMWRISMENSTAAMRP